MNIRTASRRFAFGASFLVVAGVAAINSYEHMRDVAVLGHQKEWLASTLPLSVDGMLIIASLAMAEDKAQDRRPRGWARVAFWFGAVVSLAANVASTAVHHGDVLSIGVAAWPPLALLVVTEILARPGKPLDAAAPVPVVATPAAQPAVVAAPTSAPTSPAAPAPVQLVQAVEEAMAPAAALAQMRKDPYWGARLKPRKAAA